MGKEPILPKSNVSFRRSILGVIAFVIFASLTLWVFAERRAAEREYAAYAKLRASGATGDDWVSFRELITGRPPIVQVTIPANIPVQTAFEALAALQNLEALTLAYDLLTIEHLSTIQQLQLNSLSLHGDFPSDADVDKLACLRGVRFLHVRSRNLSVNAQAKLKSRLASTKITFD